MQNNHKPKFIFGYAISFLTLGLVSISTAKEVSKDAVQKTSEVIFEWKKTYKNDSRVTATVQQNLEIIIDVAEVLGHSGIPIETKSKIEKVRDEAVRKITALDESAVPFLITQFTASIRDQFRPFEKADKEVRALVQRAMASRNRAVEESLVQIGLKAIPALTELHSISTKKQSTLISLRTRKLLDRIVKENDLAFEQAKIQLEATRTIKPEEPPTINDIQEYTAEDTVAPTPTGTAATTN